MPKVDLTIHGISGLRRYAGVIEEETYRKLSGGKALKLYKEMSDLSSVVGSVRYLMRALVRGVDWFVEEIDDSPAARDCAEFVESCMTDGETPFEDFVSEVLSFLDYGFAPFEIIYKLRRGLVDDPQRRSQYDDGKIGWRKFALRSQDTVDHWEFSDAGDLLGLWQSDPNSSQTVYIPVEKLVLFRTESTKDNPEGRSIYKNSVIDYAYLKHIQKIEAIGIERDMTGLLTMEVPIALLDQNATADKKALLAQIEEMLGQLKRDEREYAIVPPEVDSQGQPTGFKLKLLSSGGRRQIDTAAVKQSYKIAILQSVLAQFIELGMANVGSFALASSQTNTFAAALGAYLDSICATFNKQAIERLMILNGYPAEVWPHLSHGDIESPPLAEVAQYVTALAAAGQLPESADIKRKLLEIGGLPIPDVGEIGRMAAPYTEDGGWDELEGVEPDEGVE